MLAHCRHICLRRSSEKSLGWQRRHLGSYQSGSRTGSRLPFSCSENLLLSNRLSFSLLSQSTMTVFSRVKPNFQALALAISRSQFRSGTSHCKCSLPGSRDPRWVLEQVQWVFSCSCSWIVFFTDNLHVRWLVSDHCIGDPALQFFPTKVTQVCLWFCKPFFFSCEAIFVLFFLKGRVPR